MNKLCFACTINEQNVNPNFKLDVIFKLDLSLNKQNLITIMLDSPRL